MIDSRRQARKLLLGPRALAVISCALALLAAQPSLGAVEQTGSRTRVSTMRAGVGATSLEVAQPMAVAGTKRTRDGGQLEQIKSSSTRRLHVLATVEILQRLLSYELRPMESHVMPALLLEPVCVLTLDLVASPPCRGWVVEGAGISVEGDFARARLGLAPPLA